MWESAKLPNKEHQKLAPIGLTQAQIIFLKTWTHPTLSHCPNIVHPPIPPLTVVVSIVDPWITLPKTDLMFLNPIMKKEGNQDSHHPTSRKPTNITNPWPSISFNYPLIQMTPSPRMLKPITSVLNMATGLQTCTTATQNGFKPNTSSLIAASNLIMTDPSIWFIPISHLCLTYIMKQRLKMNHKLHYLHLKD